MKIVQVHNYYQQAGGEDAVVSAERAMLKEHGHQIVTYYKSNDLIARGQRSEDGGQKAETGGQKLISSRLSSVISLLRVSTQTIWNHQVYLEFRKLLQTEKPDLVHCHNTFPLISPSIYWACAKEKVLVVQTLHNYRLSCLNAFLFRQHKRTLKVENVKAVQVGTTDASGSTIAMCDDLNDGSKGAICELCVRKSFKWPGIRYRCYRESLPGSFVVAAMLFIHKLLGTWTKKVTAYIALTEFQKQKMVEEGIPEDIIWVKPNFIQTTQEVNREKHGIHESRDDFNALDDVERLTREQPYALFVGRLSPEKGCDVLIRAWHHFTANDQLQPANSANVPQLLVVGDGREREKLEKLSSDLCPPSSVTFLGKQPKETVLSLMHNALFLVLPSIWYEGFPMTIVESFACGLPVIASDDGGMHDTIRDRESGLLFPMGDDKILSQKIAWAFDHPDEIKVMGATARMTFESKYSANVNYEQLIDIYRSVAIH